MGNTKTLLSKAYLTDTSQTKFDEAFADNSRKLGISEQTQRLTWRNRHWFTRSQWTLDKVIISQINQSTFSARLLPVQSKTGQTELLFRGDARSTPGLFHPRSGELLTRTQIEPAGSSE
ncbi:MAG: hypothetical protein PBU96_12190 [Stenotrophomonas geniculata]